MTLGKSLNFSEAQCSYLSEAEERTECDNAGRVLSTVPGVKKPSGLVNLTLLIRGTQPGPFALQALWLFH